MDIVYLPHPVSAEDKAKYSAEGKRIVDAIYAPVTELNEVKTVSGAASAKRGAKKLEKDDE